METAAAAAAKAAADAEAAARRRKLMGLDAGPEVPRRQTGPHRVTAHLKFDDTPPAIMQKDE